LFPFYSTAKADLIEVTFSANGAVVGAGHLTTDGICDACKQGAGLLALSVTMGTTTFDMEHGSNNALFLRSLDKLSGSLFSDDDKLVFNGFDRFTAVGESVFRGVYTMKTVADSPRSVSTNPSAVPEASSVVLLLTVFAAVACRIRRALPG
jgi:hypothetical protein